MVMTNSLREGTAAPRQQLEKKHGSVCAHRHGRKGDTFRRVTQEELVAPHQQMSKSSSGANSSGANHRHGQKSDIFHRLPQVARQAGHLAQELGKKSGISHPRPVSSPADSSTLLL